MACEAIRPCLCKEGTTRGRKDDQEKVRQNRSPSLMRPGENSFEKYERYKHGANLFVRVAVKVSDIDSDIQVRPTFSSRRYWLIFAHHTSSKANSGLVKTTKQLQHIGSPR